MVVLESWVAARVWVWDHTLGHPFKVARNVLCTIAPNLLSAPLCDPHDRLPVCTARYTYLLRGMIGTCAPAQLDHGDYSVVERSLLAIHPES